MRRSFITAVVILAVALVPHVARAQRPDTSRVRRAGDSIVVLAPLEVHASIAPSAAPTIGSNIPARVSQLDAAQLRAWKPTVLSDVITLQPEVSAYDDIGSPKKVSLALRGFAVGPTVGTPAGVSVFLDGVRQNEPDAQEVNFDLLPMEYVKRVEVLNGTASLLGPNGIGGAINLVTDRGDGTPHGSIEAGGGSFGAGSFDASFTSRFADDWTYYAGAGGDRGDGWRAVTGYDSQHGFFNAGTMGESRGVEVQAYASRSRAATAGSLPESMFYASPRANFTAGDVDDITLGQFSVSGFQPLAGGRLSATAYARHSHADRFNANQPPDDNVRNLTATTTEGLNADWRRTVLLGGQSLDVRVGVDASADQVRVRLFDLPATGETGRDSLSTDVSSPRASVAAYALGDLHLGRATFSAGGRFDDIRSPFDDRLDPADIGGATYTRFTPRGGVRVSVASNASVYASAGSSFRAPALLELGCADPTAACPLPFALGDDPPLAPVRATTYESGGQWLLGDVMLRASLYRTDVRNEIFFVSSPGSLLSGYFTNLDRSRRAGSELDAEGMLGSLVNWRASYVRTRATFESPARLFSARSDDDFTGSPLAGPNDVRPGDEMPLVPRWQLKGGGSVTLPAGMEAGVEAQRIGPQWLRGDEANETRPLAAYTVVDAMWRLDRGPWGLDLTVHNLLDTHAAIFGTFNENLETGALERFLTPHDARTLRLTLRRELGASPPR